MNVLMLCGEIPYPPYGGSRMRVYQFIRALAARHHITLLAYQHAGDECGRVEALSKLCQVVVVRWHEPEALRRMRESGTLVARLEYGRALLLDNDPFVAQYFRRPAFKKPLLDLLAHDRFDLVHIEDTAMMTLLPDKLGLPVVLSIQNVETWRESRAGMAGLGQRIEFAKLRRYERRAFERAAVCCPTSDLEAVQIKRLVPGARVWVVPNGVDTTEFAPTTGEKTDCPALIFTGTLSYAPNAEGILWFVRAIWPLIRSAVPDVQLRIVGREPPPEVLALASNQIRIYGDVPDVRPYLHGACLAIVPLLHGGGTRLKILEALACVLPVVSTTLGAEGLDTVPGRDLLIADDAAAFAEQTVRLLRNPALRAGLGRAGRALVEQRYNWRAIVDGLEQVYLDVLH
jgi:sugar transferase (PEP-CTERM/EpsH1 system associated)